MKAITGIAAAALAFGAFAATPGHAATVEIEAEGPVIELNIVESIEAEPDLVTIGAGVRTDASTAVAALRQNSVDMTRVIERIKSLGIEEKDIQTSGIMLNPRYEYNRSTQTNEYRGYTASNRVSVKLRQVDETGEVLDMLVSAGATELSGPFFSIEDDVDPKAEARKRALERARTRANEYARMLDFDGVKILEINEALQGHQPVLQTAMRDVAIEEVQNVSAPVQPGLVSTSISMTVKFELIEDEEEEAD